MKPFEKKIWLASPTMHGEEQKYVKEAFDTNWVSTVGANLEHLEKSVRDYVGCKASVALSAGTAALHLAVKLAGVKPGDKVFCTDMTFDATVNPVTYEGGEQIFIDSEYDTWNMDPKALERAFQKYPDVKVVVLAHLYGTPSQMDEILDICNAHNAILIEDAAESLSATYKGKQTGSFGKFNVVSFNGNKIITTSGGGMLLTNDEEAAEKARKWSTQARDAAPWYQHTELGYNYRMSNVLAGIGRGQMLHLEEHKARKKEIYERYRKGLAGLPVQMNPYLSDTEPNFWLSCLIVDEDAMTEQIRNDHDSRYTKESGKSCPDEIREVLASYNIETRPIWKPMHLQPIYADHDFITAADGVCVDEDIFNRGLCLPSDIKMTVEEQDAVIEIIRGLFA